jgi:hypothetical protein
MKRKIFMGLGIILLAGFMSCQKHEMSLKDSLASSLYTSVAEIVGTHVGNINTGIEQGVAIEPFNGHGSAYPMSGGPGMGNFGMPGWHFLPSDHMRFGIPRIDSCITVSVSSSSFPRTIVIEYLKGCRPHMHNRSGKVIITLSDTITNAGAVQTIEYQDFYMDSIKIDLNATLKNLGKNSAGNWVIEKTYVQTISKEGEAAVRKNTEDQEWLSGFETADKSDNVYYLSGSGSIVVNDSARYARNITTPLLYDASCGFIKSGIVELTRNGNKTVINYGDGTCDDKATVTANGITEEINLHSNKFRDGSDFGKNCPGFGHMHKRHHH